MKRTLKLNVLILAGVAALALPALARAAGPCHEYRTPQPTSLTVSSPAPGELVSTWQPRVVAIEMLNTYRVASPWDELIRKAQVVADPTTQTGFPSGVRVVQVLSTGWDGEWCSGPILGPTLETVQPIESNATEVL